MHANRDLALCLSRHKTAYLGSRREVGEKGVSLKEGGTTAGRLALGPSLVQIKFLVSVASKCRSLKIIENGPLAEHYSNGFRSPVKIGV